MKLSGTSPDRFDVNTVFGAWPKRRLDASSSALLARMDGANISTALACSIRGWLYDFEEGNDETLRVCEASGGRLVPVATICPTRYFGMIEEVDRIVSMGFRVVRFFPTEQEWQITQRPFGRLLAKLAETRLILMVPSTEGFTTIADTLGGMRNPVIIETIRAYPALADMIVSMQDSPNLHVEMHMIGSVDFVETLVREVGEQRLLFGSGAPLQSIAAATVPIERACISDAAKARIFAGNIRNLLEMNT